MYIMSTINTANHPSRRVEIPLRQEGRYALRSLIDAHIGKTYLLVTTD